jgi:hypothetical protein
VNIYICVCAYVLYRTVRGVVGAAHVRPKYVPYVCNLCNERRAGARARACDVDVVVGGISSCKNKNKTKNNVYVYYIC